MLFDSTVFLFFFLPVSVILYYLTPWKFKNGVLVFLSAVFYAWGEPVHLILLLFVVVWNYFGGRFIVKGRRKGNARTVFFVAIGVNLLLFAAFKYVGTVLELAGNDLYKNRFFAIPIGLSFFMLQNISYLIDIYRGEVRAQKSLLNYAVLVMMFPKMIAGPLVSYGEFEGQITKRSLTWNKFSEGMLCFVRGLAKRVILGNMFLEMFDVFSAFPAGDTSALSAWLGCLAYALGMIFSFGGYCDMAVGLGRVFGFELPENVHYPCMSTGIMDYWSRWLSTLWKWFCSYVYWPVCGEDPRGVRGFFALLFTWILIGFWHGLDGTFVVWGVYFAVLIYLEGFVIGQWREKLPSFVRWMFTLLLLLVSWVFFFTSTLGETGAWLGRLIGIGGHGLIDGRALSMIKTYGVLWIVGILASTPLTGAVYERILSGEGKWKTVVNCFVYATLLFLCMAQIISGAGGEFFYYRF